MLSLSKHLCRFRIHTKETPRHARGDNICALIAILDWLPEIISEKATHPLPLPRGESEETPLLGGVGGGFIRKLLLATTLVLAVSSPAHAGRFEDLVKQLGSTNEESRAEAAESLTHIGGPRAQKSGIFEERNQVVEPCATVVVDAQTREP